MVTGNRSKRGSTSQPS